MNAASYRYLGFAFANADMLFEVSPDGAIAFAMGAAKATLAGDDAALTGRPLIGLFAPEDAPLIEGLLMGLEDGARRGTIAVRLSSAAPGRPAFAALSACRLPQLGGQLSCTLSLRPPMLLSPEGARDADGLYAVDDLEGFARPIIEIARGAGVQLDLALIEFAGLDEILAGLPPGDAAALRARAAGALRAESFGGAAAARLDNNHYALLKEAGESPERVVRRLARILSFAAGGQGVKPAARLQAVKGDGESGARSLRLIRHAVDSYLSETRGTETTGQGLNLSVQAALAQAGAFGALVADRRFKLVFQPVVSLSTGEAVHYETLVRFDGKRSPFAMIRMAEELDVIERLDIAVAEMAVRTLQADRGGGLKLAVNVSGRTITSAQYVRAALGLAGSALKDRLLFEITESAEIDDLEAAERNIRALRERGFKVCLDDFGSGAASFDYIRRMPIDIVKIDGRYVRDLAQSGRSTALVRHIVELCRELKIETVAEMVETQAVEDALRLAGVDCAQGWLYGEPGPLPAASERRARLTAARAS